MRRATTEGRRCQPQEAISIHALHEESDGVHTPSGARDSISIHALHEESDYKVHLDAAPTDISIHALHEESDRTVFDHL